MRSPPVLIAAQAAVVREFPTAMGVADRDSEAVLSAFGCPPRDVDSAVIGQGCPHVALHEDLPRAGASDEKLCGLRALGRAKGRRPFSALRGIDDHFLGQSESSTLLPVFGLLANEEGNQHKEDDYGADDHDEEAKVTFASFTHRAADPAAEGAV